MSQCHNVTMSQGCADVTFLCIVPNREFKEYKEFREFNEFKEVKEIKV